ncbi:MAG: FAD-binding oxidoreductase [Vampirovibrionales bacterium]|nr:FAD-binding oxidoreductase [Vampirovibrionales bacterium]
MHPSAPATIEIPSNLYKPNAPFSATVLGNHRVTDPSSPNDVRHVTFDLAGGNLTYLEGQSLGVLPPGIDAATQKPHKLRLYSIASTAQGDNGKGHTVSLCVKRVAYTCPQTGNEIKGVCSNFVCDLQPGDTVQVTGPVGKSFLMPNALGAPPNANVIMVATGTGIAPFRAFVKKRFENQTQESGQYWLFFGVQSRADFMYESEWQTYQNDSAFHLVTAFSREEKTDAGERMYVQHRLAEHGAQLLSLLTQPNTYFYICGLRGMEAGIHAGLTTAAQAAGQDWPALHAQMQAEHRWHVEVY